MGITKQEELKSMLETMRSQTIKKVEVPKMGLPDYMRPYVLHRNDDNGYPNGEITNTIYVDKKFSDHISDPRKKVDYIQFESNGAVTIFFETGQQPIWTRTDASGPGYLEVELDDIDVQTLDQI